MCGTKDAFRVWGELNVLTVWPWRESMLKKSVDRTHTIWLILSTQLKFSSRHPSSYSNFYYIFEYLRKTGLKYRVEKLKGHTSNRPKRMKQ